MNAGNYEVECFVHIFNSCTQNNYTIASIFEHLFRSIKAEYPLIHKAYIRSDNAGCYHNGPLLLCLPEIGKTTGITVARYDFSERQSGKDICDRKIAPMKAHIRIFVNENHDVVSAEDMKVALEYHGGLKRCRAAVVEVDSSQDLYEGNKIPDISLLYNFQYETSGIRVWKAYETGKGKLLTYKDHQFQPQNVASLKVVKPFGPRQKERGAIGKASKTAQAEIFSCSESTCILTFRSEREIQAHMDTAKHIRELESVSLYDEIRRKWAERVTGISTVAKPTPSVFTQV
ncbi:Transposon Tf2-6 poly [Paramuricea clavata]|uniref:Transposon Tf2-6 poly n=1 Tax=Paramuricea clavata TaxID=317549 RepID=A0A6S7J351_PARCT|nr:Transposon Tf2-6 poly [Paramuricea clavata]